MTNEEIFDIVKDSLVNVYSISETEIVLDKGTDKYTVNRIDWEKDYNIEVIYVNEIIDGELKINSYIVSKK